jgi:RNA polymerase sigma-70 factor (ECF subfamily)
MLGCNAALYRYARALCHDPEHAADLVQETYRRALSARKKPSGASEEDLRAWLFTILRHVWQNEIRGRLHAVQEGGDSEHAEASDEATPETEMMRRLLQSEVRQAIDALPALFREVIVLREIENLSYAEIARILGCPAGTVMSRLSRARSILRTSLVAASRTARQVEP